MNKSVIKQNTVKAEENEEWDTGYKNDEENPWGNNYNTKAKRTGNIIVPIELEEQPKKNEAPIDPEVIFLDLKNFRV